MCDMCDAHMCCVWYIHACVWCVCSVCVICNVHACVRVMCIFVMCVICMLCACMCMCVMCVFVMCVYVYMMYMCVHMYMVECVCDVCVVHMCNVYVMCVCVMFVALAPLMWYSGWQCLQMDVLLNELGSLTSRVFMIKWLLGTDCLERKQELVNTALQMSHLEIYLHKKREEPWRFHPRVCFLLWVATRVYLSWAHTELFSGDLWKHEK